MMNQAALLRARASLQTMADLLFIEATPRKLSGFKRQNAAVAAQRQVRAQVARDLENDLNVYFDDLSQKVSARMIRAMSPNVYAAVGLPEVNYLLTTDDERRMQAILNQAYTNVIAGSWNIYNVELGANQAFDPNSQLVARILDGCGDQIGGIAETTRDAARKTLQYGQGQAWTIQEMIFGAVVAGSQVPGLRNIVGEVFRHRTKTIARTELGDAQNEASIARYQDAGVERVRVFDNGKDDADAPCRRINGQIVPLAWALEHKLEHPNCSRTFAPILPGE
jgi:hypothetical protein